LFVLSQLYLEQLGQVPKHGRTMFPDPLNIFAANLRRIRQECGLSQERLAHKADLHMSHVAKIERSEREPGVRSVSKLAKTLGVSASELFDGIDGRNTREEGGIGSGHATHMPASRDSC
jgi:ribosome-binding protein aMBF1 (putative translation factor)